MSRMIRIAFLLLVPWLLAGRAQPAAAASAIRISQLYGGGGGSNPAAAYNRDYIELYNSSPAAVDISGWALEYGSATGNWGSSAANRFVFPPGTIMQPGRYLLLSTGAAGSGGPPLTITPDFDGSLPGGPTMNLSAASGKLALFTTENANLSCGNELPGTLVDKVAYGTATCPEGTAVTTLNLSVAAVRKAAGITDTDDNAADFDVVANPVPRNSGYVPGGPLPAPTNLQAQIACNSILLTWDAVPGATQYRLTLDGAFYATTAATSHQGFGQDGLPHTYGVAALDGGSNPGSEATLPGRVVPSDRPHLELIGSNLPTTGSYAGTAFPGQSLRLVTRLRPTSDVPLDFAWKKDGVPLASSLDGRIQVTNYLPDSSVVVIQPVLRGDAGSYNIDACNLCGCALLDPFDLVVAPNLPAPAGLVLEPAGCQALQLSWNVVPFATGYVVTADNYAFADTLPGTAITLAPPDGWEQSYTVGALDIEGAPGEASISSLVAASWPPAGFVIEGEALLLTGDDLVLSAVPPDDLNPDTYHYTWRRDGVALAGAPDSPELTITGVGPAHSGSYSVVVTGDCGTQTTDALGVTVLGAPAGVTATPGCHAVSVAWTTVAGVDHYRVLRGGVLVAPSVVAPPWVDAAPPSGPLCYAVVAVLPDARETPASTPVCATASQDPPLITSTLTNATRAVGGTIQFTAQFTGNPTSWTWRFNGMPIPNAPNGPTYLRTNLQVADGGLYDVIACNGCGCDTSNAATLTVCVTPRVLSMPSTVWVLEGSPSASIPATFSGVQSIRWYKKGVALEDGPKYQGTTTPTLVINSPGAADADFYYAGIAANCAPSTTRACELKVQACVAPPTVFTQQPVSQPVNFGQSATLTAAATGCGALNYTWQKKQADGTWKGVGGGQTYLIPVVGSQSAGTYRCTAGVTNGPQAYSNPADVTFIPLQITNVTTRPLGCSSAVVRWQTNYPVTATVRYGRTPADLSSTATGHYGYADSVIIGMSGPAQVSFRVEANYSGMNAATTTQTAYFTFAVAQLAVSANPLPATATLVSAGDAVSVRITPWSSGCQDITSPVTITELRLSTVQPRRPDQSVDLPRVLSETGVMKSVYAGSTEFLFPRAALPYPSGTSVTLTGFATYADSTARRTYIYAKIYLP